MRFLALCFAAGFLLCHPVVSAQAIDLSSVKTLDLIANPPVPIKIDATDDTLEFLRIVQGFDKPSIERSELLQKSKEFVKDFPQSEHGAFAEDFVRILTRMSTEELPPQSKLVERLIFLQRDQHGAQISQPGVIKATFTFQIASFMLVIASRLCCTRSRRQSAYLKWAMIQPKQNRR